MAISRKALVVCMAVLVVWVPVFAQPILLGVFPTKQAAEQALGTSPTASQSSVVLPQGKELSSAQLKDTDGEGFFSWIAGTLSGAFGGGVVGAGVYGVSHWWHWSLHGLGHAMWVGAAAGAGWGATIGYLLPW